MEENEQEIVNRMREDRRIAENYILNYTVLKKEYESGKAEWMEKSRPPVDTNVGGGKSNLPGHPVEDAAIKSAEYDADHSEYLWLKAVGIAFRTFDAKRRIYIACRQRAEHNANQWRGRKSWVVFTQMSYDKEFGKRFINSNGWMSERTVRRWWRQIIDRVVEIHLRIKNFNSDTV